MTVRRAGGRCSSASARSRPRSPKRARLAAVYDTILAARFDQVDAAAEASLPAGAGRGVRGAARRVALVADSARPREPPLDARLNEQAAAAMRRQHGVDAARAAARGSLVLSRRRLRAAGAVAGAARLSGSPPRATARRSKTRSSAPWSSTPVSTTRTSASAPITTTQRSPRRRRRSCAGSCFSPAAIACRDCRKCCRRGSAACCCAAKPTTSSTSSISGTSRSRRRRSSSSKRSTRATRPIRCSSARIAEVQDQYFHDRRASAAAWQTVIDRARAGRVYNPPRAESRAHIGRARLLERAGDRTARDRELSKCDAGARHRCAHTRRARAPRSNDSVHPDFLDAV